MKDPWQKEKQMAVREEPPMAEEAKESLAEALSAAVDDGVMSIALHDAVDVTERVISRLKSLVVAMKEDLNR